MSLSPAISTSNQQPDTRNRSTHTSRAEMREFMDYVHGAFYEATGWNRDNSYAVLNSTSDGSRQPLLHLCRELLTDKTSAIELPNTTRTASNIIVIIEPEFRDIVPAWLCRRRGRIDLVSLFLSPSPSAFDTAIRNSTSSSSPSII